jgi:hypothetical protein
MTALLVLLAICAGGLGLLFLSQATTGVGLIAGGCLLAIFARLVQAEQHQREWRERTGTATTPPAPSGTEPNPDPAAAVATPTHVAGREWATGVVIIVAAAVLLIGLRQFLPLPASTAPTAPAVAQPSIGGVLRPVRMRTRQTATGWRIDNVTNIAWAGCVAEVGVSKVTIGELNAYGARVLESSDFTPPLTSSSPSTLDLACERQITR